MTKTMTKHYVEVESWDTKVSGRPHNFKAPPSDWVSPGPVTPLETDFATLTDAQRTIMRIENFHYMVQDFKQKMADPDWFAVHGWEVMKKKK